MSFHLLKILMCDDFEEVRHDMVDAIRTCEVFSMPEEERIKIWIKYIVIYQYGNHERCIDTSSIKHPSHKSLMRYYRKCVSEVEALRRDKMCRNVTLYDFVTKGHSLNTGLTDEDFMGVYRHRFENAQPKIYPIYEDMVLDKATETFRRLSGRSDCIWHSLYRRKWDDIFHGKTVLLYIATCCTVAMINNNSKFWKAFDLEDAFAKWENLEALYVDKAKLLLNKTLLFKTEFDIQTTKIGRPRALSCYPFLISYCNACWLEVQMMQKDEINENLMLSQFLSPYCIEQEEMAPANVLRDESIFKKVLKRKYMLNLDIIASGIERSFLNDMMFGQCISIVVPDNESKNEAGSESLKDIILFPHLTRNVCDFLPQGDLLNLVLAFSILYNNPNFIEEPPAPRKRKRGCVVNHPTSRNINHIPKEF